MSYIAYHEQKQAQEATANEKRLIDANALKWKIGQVRLYVASLRFGKTIISQILKSYQKAVFDEIEDAPTVDAVEVVHGRWDRWWCDNYLQYFHRCSVCGDDALTEDGTMHDEVLSNYCPNCGAKMDGERRDGE